MVDALIEGKIEKIYVEHADRLSRVPALTRLVEHLAKKNGATIIALDREADNVDETKNNLLELIEFVAHALLFKSIESLVNRGFDFSLSLHADSGDQFCGRRLFRNQCGRIALI